MFYRKKNTKKAKKIVASRKKTYYNVSNFFKQRVYYTLNFGEGIILKRRNEI